MPAVAPSATVTDVEEAAWRTAVEAAPWLVGEPDKAIDPNELDADWRYLEMPRLCPDPQGK
jgi:hypothetical protein